MIPPRGYWAKVQYGYHVEIPPLPKLRKHGPVSHIIHEQKVPKQKQMAADWPEANDLILKEIETGKRIIVSEKLLKDPHSKNRPLSIKVSRLQSARALRIMDALIKGLEERGFMVFPPENRRKASYVEIIGEKVHFALNERLRRIEKVLTDSDKIRLRRGLDIYRYDYVPSGKLFLEIKEWCGRRKRRIWSDTSKQLVENILNDFVIGLIKIADARKAERIERDKRRRQMEDERQLREEQNRLFMAEKERLQQLETQSERWIKAEQIRSYVQEIKRQASERHISEKLADKLEKWASWANDHANRIDPTTNGLPFEFDETD
jgi:hypothetical protein